MFADWALLVKEQQIERYEYLRDRRVLLPDVVIASGGDDDGDGGDGDGGPALDDGNNTGYAGWTGDDLREGNSLDCGIEDGWDGDYPDGYGDDPGDAIDVGGLTGGPDGGVDGGDVGGDDGGDGGGSEGSSD